jgi:hypothetical protein
MPLEDPVHLMAAWDRLTDDERQLFHQFTCENDQSSAALKVMTMLAAAARIDIEDQG